MQRFSCYTEYFGKNLIFQNEQNWMVGNEDWKYGQKIE